MLSYSRNDVIFRERVLLERPL